MAWVSPKVYAILSSSEEGKDIIEKLPDMSQDECQKELDAFFGEGGKGSNSAQDYSQAKIDDEAEEERYKAMGDEEVSEKDYEDDISDDEISEQLGDYTWSVTPETTAGQYAQECADRLGCSKERVFEIIKQQAPDQIKESSKMGDIIDAWEGDYEYKDEDVFDKNYQQALKTNNYEKARNMYNDTVKEYGEDSEEAKGIKKALDEMKENFDKGENHISIEEIDYEKEFGDLSSLPLNAINLLRRRMHIYNGEQLAKAIEEKPNFSIGGKKTDAIVKWAGQFYKENKRMPTEEEVLEKFYKDGE